MHYCAHSQHVHAATFSRPLHARSFPFKSPNHESESSSKSLVPIVADHTNDYHYCVQFMVGVFLYLCKFPH